MLPGKISGPKIPRSGKSIMLKIREDLKRTGIELSYNYILRVVRLFFGSKIGIGFMMRNSDKDVHIKRIGTFVKNKKD